MRSRSWLNEDRKTASTNGAHLPSTSRSVGLPSASRVRANSPGRELPTTTPHPPTQRTRRRTAPAEAGAAEVNGNLRTRPGEERGTGKNRARKKCAEQGESPSTVTGHAMTPERGPPRARPRSTRIQHHPGLAHTRARDLPGQGQRSDPTGTPPPPPTAPTSTRIPMPGNRPRHHRAHSPRNDSCAGNQQRQPDLARPGPRSRSRTRSKSGGRCFRHPSAQGAGPATAGWIPSADPRAVLVWCSPAGVLAR